MKTKATVYRHKCKRCPHEWNSLNSRPVVCPRCKSYSWDKVAEKKTA